MITRVARSMAVAAFVSNRCQSFIHSGHRFVGIGTRVAKHFAARHPSPHVEQGTVNQSQRGNADDTSLDIVLISKDPQLVLNHLKARRMGEETLHAVHKIGGDIRTCSYAPSLVLFCHNSLLPLRASLHKALSGGLQWKNANLSVPHV